jgi:hypothetical protein
MYFSSLLWVDDQCGAAIRELFQVAAMWKEVGDDLLACEDVEMGLIQYRCLQQRFRVTQFALDVMFHQLGAKREVLWLNGIITGDERQARSHRHPRA